jgi:hypothetical protein
MHDYRLVRTRAAVQRNYRRLQQLFVLPTEIDVVFDPIEDGGDLALFVARVDTAHDVDSSFANRGMYGWISPVGVPGVGIDRHKRDTDRL